MTGCPATANLFHDGDPEQARIEALYQGYAAPE